MSVESALIKAIIVVAPLNERSSGALRIIFVIPSFLCSVFEGLLDIHWLWCDLANLVRSELVCRHVVLYEEGSFLRFVEVASKTKSLERRQGLFVLRWTPNEHLCSVQCCRPL